MKLKGKAGAILAARNKKAREDGSHINRTVGMGHLALDKVASTKEAPCVALTRTNPPVNPENRGLVPTSEGVAELVRAKRQKFAGKHLPVVHCNVCRFTQVCTQYKAGFQCAFIDQMMKRIDNAAQIPDFLKMLLEAQMGRIQQALIFEQLAGGGMTEEVTLALDSTFAQLEKTYRLYKEIDGDGKGKAAGDSIIERLFGKVLPVKTEEIPSESKKEESEEASASVPVAPVAVHEEEQLPKPSGARASKPAPKDARPKSKAKR